MRGFSLDLALKGLLSLFFLLERAILLDLAYEALHHRLDTLLNLLQRVHRHVGKRASLLREAGFCLILDRFLLFLDQVFFRDFFIDILQETVLKSICHYIHKTFHLRLRFDKSSTFGAGRGIRLVI